MKKILVTGITGFAGSFLAEYLAKDTQLELDGTFISEKGISNIESVRESIQLKKIDLTDFDAVNEYIKQLKPDQIYHLAAFPSPAESFKDPAGFLRNNINAELYLLESLKEYSPSSKMLVVSSSEVYGLIHETDLPIDEETPLRPVSPYGVSKIAQDYLGLQYFLAYAIPVIRVRPFGHIGPRLSEQFAASSFAKKIAEIEKGKREPVLTVGNLKSRRDLTDVRDIVRAYTMLMEKGTGGDVYNVGSGKSYVIEDILDQLLNMSTSRIDVQIDAGLLRPNDIPELRCDTTKISRVTGWKPEFSLEQSLRELLEYWRKSV